MPFFYFLNFNALYNQFEIQIPMNNYEQQERERQMEVELGHPLEINHYIGKGEVQEQKNEIIDKYYMGRMSEPIYQQLEVPGHGHAPSISPFPQNQHNLQCPPIGSPVPSSVAQRPAAIPINLSPADIICRKLSATLFIFVVSQIVYGCSFITARYLTLSSMDSSKSILSSYNICTAAGILMLVIIINAGGLLIYLLINLIIYCQGKQTLDLPCSDIYLFDKKDKMTIFVIFFIWIFWIVALVCYLWALSRRINVRKMEVYRPEGSEARIQHNYL